MAFASSNNGIFVRVWDTAMQRAYYISPAAWKAFDQVSPNAQARLETASEFVINGRGEISKSPLKMDALISDYLTLRGGGAIHPPIPQSVRDALAVLVAAVG